VKEKGSSFKLIHKQLKKGKNIQEALEPDYEEISNQTFRVHKGAL
jgi:hypothetical protein